MSTERNLIFSLLKLTQKTPTLTKHLKNDTNLPIETIYDILEKLQSENLLSMDNGIVKVSINDRLKLAVKAVTLGADIEYVSDQLCWQEFEEITAMALRNNNFTVYKNVRFKTPNRKWEIDVVGCKQPLTICIDCKHWTHTIAPTTLTKIANAQADRTKALTETLPNPKLQLECTKWKTVQFIPTILSLTQNSQKFHNNIPIVPILQLQNFLNQLPAYVHQLKTYPKMFSHINQTQ
ncbi:MAG: NERD domain-containing protein [Candidatus Bathyarchaeota archaeon]|nr:NERD domain-containing protein [Candidatus Termiticorpusculum sp.]